MKKLEQDNIQDILALTPLQAGMLYHYLKEQASQPPVEQLNIRISGDIDIDRFEESWNLVVHINGMLRTLFRWEKLEKPIQITLKKHHMKPGYYDFSEIPLLRVPECLEDVKKKKRIMDLHSVPFTVTLCKLEKNKYEMIISYHHILYDGWSNGIILKEFFNTYASLCDGNKPVIPAKTKFKEFIKWHHTHDSDQEQQYWHTYLKGIEAQTRLSSNSTYRNIKEKCLSQTARYQWKFNREFNRNSERFVKEQKLTLASLLYGAWGLLLQRYNDGDDVVFGTTVSGRSARIRGIEEIVGLLINTLPLRVRRFPHEVIADLLSRINLDLQAREKYEATALTDIKEYSELNNNESLFDTVVIIENYPLDSRIIPENSRLEVESCSITENPHYDLTVEITVAGGIEITYIYNTACFDEADIIRFANHYRHIIEETVNNPGKKISRIEIISTDEKERILYHFNNSSTDHSADKTIHNLIETQAERIPDNTAVIGDVQLTYGELNRRSNHLAQQLKRKGVPPGSIVGIMMERSIEMIIALFGILKAGNAYLPIDPGYPAQRIRFMLADSNVGVLVTSPQFRISHNPETTLQPSPSTLTSNPGTPACDHSLAYILYTSGSTGKPKGVAIEHGAVVNLLQALQTEYPFDPGDTYLFKTSYVFDVSVTEIFGWFPGGGRLKVLEKDGEKSPTVILDSIEKDFITHINFVPSMLSAFLEALSPQNIGQIERLKYIFSAGEVLAPELVSSFKGKNTKIVLENLYGPTEATVYSSKYPSSHWDGTGSIPIGGPLRNIALWIFDKDGHLQPIGIPGELCISGMGVARGYLNRPELTARQFSEDLPYSVSASSAVRIYRTGDLARWLPDGNIEFLGRIDQQVKIRGYRIELGEIENLLLNHKEIKETAVTSKKEKNGENYLCAYIVPLHPDSFDISCLSRYLLEKLPQYMVPAYFVPLRTIPRTAAGKIRYTALPQPQIHKRNIYVPPRNADEEMMAAIWSRVLGIEKEKIGIHDNFFTLGGHSLKATALVTRIHKAFDVEIPLGEFLKCSTIMELTGWIEKAKKSVHQTILPAEKKEYYPLLTTQKRFFVFQRLEPSSVSYNIAEVMRIHGALSPSRFENIFRQLIQRHDTLRTSFHLVDGEPVQKIHEDVDFEIQGDFATNDEYNCSSEKERSAREILTRFTRPFDLSAVPLIRLGFMKIGHEEHFLMFDMHHIISDGVSIGIFIKEFLTLYQGKDLPPLRIRYKDYIQWRQKNNKREVGSQRLTPAESDIQEEVLNLPLDCIRPAEPRFEGETITFEIGGWEKEQLYHLAREQNTTLFMILSAVFNIFLSKLSSQENIVMGAPIAGRQHIQLEGIVGLFINTLTLRNFPTGEKSYLEFLKEVKKNAMDAFNHQDYQYDQLVEQVISARERGRNPLFDVMFAFQNMEMPPIEFPGLKVIRGVEDIPSSKLDMTLYCEEYNQLSFKMEYSTALFKEGTILRFIRYFKKILTDILENPSIKIAVTEILPPDEKQRILYDFNDTELAFSQDKTINQVLSEQAKKTPDRVAVLCSDNSMLTYSRLNEKSNRLAGLLRKKGVKPGTIVGVMLERSLEVIAAIQAILKAGGAYLPIDPTLPDNRVLSMLNNSGAALLLTDADIFKTKSMPRRSPKQEFLLLDQLSPQLTEESEHNPKPISGPGDLIYIIFTSGSTGKPKGAGVYHRGFMNLMNWFVEDFELGRRDTNILITSLSFDLTQKNLYASMMNGGRLCIPLSDYFEPRTLGREIFRYEVTWLNCTPSMFCKLVEYEEAGEWKNLASLRYVFLGGEPISLAPLIRWLRSGDCSAEIVNTYGPTECTDICNSYRIKDPERFLKETIPVGKPVYNVQLYILNKHRQPVPVGSPGELCIAGKGVGIGYINDKQLTDQKFFMKSFEPGKAKQLLYRTGDRVKWLADGNIEFLGRLDHQVKIRGFRIEPGEIETLLLNHAAVKEVVVMVRKRENNDLYLCAYIVPHSPASFELAPVKEYLTSELPAYMVPDNFVTLEKMPLNPNGKVNRKALPEPDNSDDTDYMPPGNDTEKRLLDIWAEILNLDKNRIGINDNFFRLGGHSLKAAGLIGRIHKAFSVEISIIRLFKIPTIKKIAGHIRESVKHIFSSLAPVEYKEYYPQSSAQKRLFIIHHMNPVAVTYNIPALIRLEGSLDRPCMEQSFRNLINRHQSLRSSFETIDGNPVQRIHPQVEFELEFRSLEYETQIPDVTPLMKDFIRPFDLAHAPLLHAKLLRVRNKTHLLMFDMHHIICDGISMDIFISEFTALYAGEDLPPVRLHYKDFSHWQSRVCNSSALKTQENYWLKEMTEDIPRLELPLDYQRPSIKAMAGHSVSFEIKQDHIDGLMRLALETETTFFMVLLTLYSTLLSKLSGQEDIIVGSPAAGRPHQDLENIIGVFINTLVLRTFPSPEKPFNQLLAEVEKTCLNGLENQDYQYEELVEKVVTERDISRNSLFDVMLVLQNVKSTGKTLRDLDMIPCQYGGETSKLDMTLTAVEKIQGYDFTITYSTKLFREETIRRFIDYFKRLISTVLEDNTRPLSDLDILSQKEKFQLLREFNDTARQFQWDKTIHRIFADQARRTPFHIALKGADMSPGTNRPVSITYSQLNKWSTHLAHGLQEKGIKTGNVVGIIAEQSIRTIIGTLAILKAGGAYLPVNPDYPPERIRYMLADSNAQALLTTRTWAGEANILSDPQWAGNIHIAFIDSVAASDLASPGDMLPVSSHPSDPVYVIYTSGSTGKSKGVILEHGNLMNYVYWFQGKTGLNQEDRAVLTSAFCFDLGYTSVYPPLLCGGQVHIPPSEVYLSPQQAVDYIIKNEISYTKLTPSLFSTLVNVPSFSRGDCRSLRLVVLGGEEIKVQDVKKTYGNGTDVRIINHYGPTEACIGCVAQFIDSDHLESYAERPTIGHPIANMKAHILDKSLNLVPLGVAGQLCVSGRGVASGYLNQPQLTHEKFRPSLHLADENRRMYLTGDMARRLPGGKIQFLGRMDGQVKIRGYRIETGEIESLLANFEKIKEAAVILRQSPSDDRYLCAYIVWKNTPLHNSHNSRDSLETSEKSNFAQLKEHLAEKLPSYMIPSYFITLSQLPVTPNGKLNRKQLPEPQFTGESSDYTAPSGWLEKKLVRLWQEVLGVETVGTHDNFFQMGGHSLKAINMVSRIHQELEVKVLLAELFKRPTIHELSRYINSCAPTRHLSIEPVEKKEYYALSAAQKRLYIMYRMDDKSIAYNLPRTLILKEEVDKHRLSAAIQEIIKRQECLRTSFHMIDNQPVQKVDDISALEVECSNGGQQTYEEIVKAFLRPFDLTKAPLLRVGLIKHENGNSLLIIDMHHIIGDGVSGIILREELTALYRGETLPPLNLQYKDYSHWQNCREQQQEIKKQEQYWLQEFQGVIPPLNLPMDYERPVFKRFEGGEIYFQLDEEHTRALREIARQEGATIFMTLLAIYNILLSRLSGVEDIIVGTATVGRWNSRLMKLIGMFVNTLALRNFPSGDKTFTAFLKEVKDRTLTAFDNQEYPFEDLMEHIDMPRAGGRSLADIMFGRQNIDLQTDYTSPKNKTQDSLAPANIEYYDYNTGTAKFDLCFNAREEEDCIVFYVEYSTRLFKPERIQQYISYYKEIASLVKNNPHIKLADIKIIRDLSPKTLDNPEMEFTF